MCRKVPMNATDPRINLIHMQRSVIVLHGPLILWWCSKLNFVVFSRQECSHNITSENWARDIWKLRFRSNVEDRFCIWWRFLNFRKSTMNFSSHSLTRNFTLCLNLSSPHYLPLCSISMWMNGISFQESYIYKQDIS